MPDAARKWLDSRSAMTSSGEEGAGHIRRLLKQVDDYEASFELYHSASMRAIKMWKETTGKDLMWPDQAHLIVHVMEENTALKENLSATQEFAKCGVENGNRQFEDIETLQRQVKKLREALYGEYCNCGRADATTLPNTHEFSCRYRVVMRRIESGGE